MHPFAAPLGELNTGERYDAILAGYGDVARAQLVCALQVHVALGSADRTLAVYNALRGHLPELAALAANAPFLAGRDTGLASVRPLIGGLLPRQGVPPVIPSWEAFAEMLRWVDEPRLWWWELRPHATFGTLEIRVCDAQTTVAEAEAVAAFAFAMVAWLAARFDAGEALGAPESWRIAENRWVAARHGLDGMFRGSGDGGAAAGARRAARAAGGVRAASGGGGAGGAQRRDASARTVGRATRRRGWLTDRFVPAPPGGPRETTGT